MCNELSVVGLSVQAEKSAFICLGRPKKYRNLSVKINVNDILLDSVAELRCLGVHFTAGHKLKFQFDCCKAKFYNAINAILAYVGNKADVVLLWWPSPHRFSVSAMHLFSAAVTVYDWRICVFRHAL